jgi:hypothetical protein
MERFVPPDWLQTVATRFFGYEVQTSMRIGSTMPLVPFATQTFLHRLIVGPAPGREGLA